MQRIVTLALFAATLAACGDIKVNPYTKEGRAPRPAQQAAEKPAAEAPTESTGHGH